MCARTCAYVCVCELVRVCNTRLKVDIAIFPAFYIYACACTRMYVCVCVVHVCVGMRTCMRVLLASIYDMCAYVFACGRMCT